MRFIKTGFQGVRRLCGLVTGDKGVCIDKITARYVDAFIGSGACQVPSLFRPN